MIITNFASGELSETLFGRTDLPQYFQGAARLENFDVIPTGGIKKRAGTQALMPVDESRIIPFYVDKEHSYILFLSPNVTAIYSTSTGTAVYAIQRGYPDMNVINEVQYAQHYNTMILVHKSTPPVQITMSKTPQGADCFIIDQFISDITTDVKTTGADTGDSSLYQEDDESPYLSDFLQGTWAYPSCVSFFQGRLFFAATKQGRQRIWASKTGEKNKFATYEKIITSVREYIVVNATLVAGDSVITVGEDYVYGLNKPATEYTVHENCPYFDPGTKISSIQGNTIILTDKAKIQVWPTEEPRELEMWRGVWKSADEYPITKVIGTCRLYGSGSQGEMDLSVVLYAQKFKILAGLAPSKERLLTIKDKGSAETSVDMIYNLAISSPALSGYDRHITKTDPRIIEAAGLLDNRRNTALAYNLWSRDFTGTIEKIYADIIAWSESGTSVYIPFYTVEIKEEKAVFPDTAFTFEINSDMNDTIKWMAQNKDLIVGTEMSEWVIPRDVTATNIRATLNSRFGSDDIQATTIGDAVVFIQNGRKALVEYNIPQQDNYFRSNNMNLLNPEILRAAKVFDIDFISSPYTKIILSLENGRAATLLYDRTNNVFAWNRIVTTDGEIKSVATAPGTQGYDEIFFIVKRGDNFFLEVLKEDETIYLDSWVAWASATHELLAPYYSEDAIVWDKTDGTVYPKTQAPIADHEMYIGYLYAAIIRSMPILPTPEQAFGNKRVTRLDIRFSKSYMPKVRSIKNGEEREANTITGKTAPFTGVAHVPFPGGYAEDVQFELVDTSPNPVNILSLNAEAQ
jgi:hypothetical protein